jgi:hypothetical protein
VAADWRAAYCFFPRTYKGGIPRIAGSDDEQDEAAIRKLLSRGVPDPRNPLMCQSPAATAVSPAAGPATTAASPAASPIAAEPTRALEAGCEAGALKMLTLSISPISRNSGAGSP